MRSLLGVAADFALWQRLLQFSNLSLGEGVVGDEVKTFQLCKSRQGTDVGELVSIEIE